MKKRIIFVAIVGGLVGAGIMGFDHWQENRTTSSSVSKKEMAEFAAGQKSAETVATSILAPLDFSKPVRLAVGGLGLKDNELDQELGDLVTAKLTDADGFTLIERRSMDPILHELNLSLSGFVRAQEAVRVGRLLKVDWFLLATEANIKGKDSFIVRVVDAHAGLIRDAGVVPRDKSLEQSAADLARFLRQSRQNAANAKFRMFLAIGSFEDLSVNNRQADFLKQLRGYLTASYQGSDITILEREYVDTLLQEIHLDLAGLTENDGTNPPPAMQSAFWLLTGKYQSYETTNVQVEVNYEVQRIFGTGKFFTLRGSPDESTYRRIKESLDKAVHENMEVITPTRVSEARAQMAIGRELAIPDKAPASFFLPMVEHGYQELDEQTAARSRRNAEEAIRSFEIVLLLQPTNREAKLYLGACLRKQVIGKVDEARNLYREVLEEVVQDKWTGLAQQALSITFDYQGRWGTPPAEKLRWFNMALAKNSNPVVTEFYKQNIKEAETEITIQSGNGSKASGLAEQQLFAAIASSFNVMEGKGGMCYGDYGMNNFIHDYGENRPADGIARLAEIYPRMKAEFPQVAPYLLETVVSYQTDTNSPLVAELEHTLDWEIANPDKPYKSKSTSVVYSIYQWCMKKNLFPLALKALERDRRVFGVNKVGTRTGQEDSIALGYAYMGAEKWKEALAVFESLSNRPVLMAENGPWGRGLCPVLTSRVIEFCRDKLNLPQMRDPLEFDLGKQLIWLPPPATFAADNDGLWIGINGQLMQLDFELNTNFVVNLPMDASARISSICTTPTSVWVGTLGEGLIACDKQTHKCRHFTVEDGMMMNAISSMNLRDNTLWIGYGHEYRVVGASSEQSGEGGLGFLNLSSLKFSSFTPSIADDVDTHKITRGNLATESTDAPTSRGIRTLVTDSRGQVWFATEAHPLRRYRVTENDWKGFPNIRQCSSLATDAGHLFVGTYGNYFGKQPSGPLGIWVMDFQDNNWRQLKSVTNLLPDVVTTIASDGPYLWVGGLGYIAQVDPVQDKILHFAYVKSPTVDRIQIAGGYVWAQFDWRLYRVPISQLQ
jgi:tetratricopeptide (TPR) repeat protein